MTLQIYLNHRLAFQSPYVAHQAPLVARALSESWNALRAYGAILVTVRDGSITWIIGRD